MTNYTYTTTMSPPVFTGNFPYGMSYNSTTGILSGNPQITGTYNFTVSSGYKKLGKVLHHKYDKGVCTECDKEWKGAYWSDNSWCFGQNKQLTDFLGRAVDIDDEVVFGLSPDLIRGELVNVNFMTGKIWILQPGNRKPSIHNYSPNRLYKI